MKKALAALAILISLSACAGPKQQEQSMEEYHLTLQDGRQVTCISLTLVGSFSCDWEGAK
jgi:hypothetical protein